MTKLENNPKCELLPLDSFLDVPVHFINRLSALFSTLREKIKVEDNVQDDVCVVEVECQINSILETAKQVSNLKESQLIFDGLLFKEGIKVYFSLLWIQHFNHVTCRK